MILLNAAVALACINYTHLIGDYQTGVHSGEACRHSGQGTFEIHTVVYHNGKDFLPHFVHMNLIYHSMYFFPSFSLAEISPRGLQITG